MKLISKIINGAINKILDRDSLAQETNERPIGNGVIYDSMKAKCLEMANDSLIMLKNDDEVLPLKDSDELAVFGRCAYDYFYCGYGSGGDVKREYGISPIEGIKSNGINYNRELDNIYLGWTKNKKNIPDEGFWGHWPLNYSEMPLNDEIVKKASLTSNKAIYVLGRAAGEDRDCLLKKGSYFLKDDEHNALSLIFKYFKDVILLLDIGNIMDLSFTLKYKFKSILLPYQAGQEAGDSIAQILKGDVSPSGRLTDTIAIDYIDYPSSKDFYNRKYNEYKEDIFVGYRYFETFKKDRVLFPFGYGLSYSKFDISVEEIKVTDYNFEFNVVIENIGERDAKEVVELYLKKPGIKFSEPERILVSFAKTKELKPKEKEKLNLSVDLRDFSSYDDKGVISDASYVLEEGKYDFFLGEDVRSAKEVYSINYRYDEVVKKVSHIMPLPKSDIFKRMINENGNISYEKTPTYDIDLKKIILDNLPKEIPLKEYQGHKLIDVKNGVITLDEFISELTIDELNALCHGEGGMNSPLGPKGNGGAMGGVTKSLIDKGIPSYIVCDGPSGMRVSVTSTLLPSGVTIASSWNTKLIEELFYEEYREMKDRKIACILAPGMNIHRNPLCGRNFEYFSEDPYLSGVVAAAVCNGVDNEGYTATPKHLFGNNQETNRHHNDSRISERAIREIYLRNFEYCLKLSDPKQLMTSYNLVNSIYSHNNYYLTQIYLREELGYKWNVMTDWWMRYRVSPDFKNVFGNAYRVRSRCDVLMPGSKSAVKPKVIGNSLLENYGKEGAITLCEIEECARDLLKTILASPYFN
ncbi:MAG: glycoside hydrolase family 3 C-terminal domain-containing protein [Gammaproteobacteria bacterium]|nr:glycoside hydrolase family 3 C-terminal domain-containing protein [Gammaproteobacteria bacterium]